jgi:hypothetical protein
LQLKTYAFEISEHFFDQTNEKLSLDRKNNS